MLQFCQAYLTQVYWPTDSTNHLLIFCSEAQPGCQLASRIITSVGLVCWPRNCCRTVTSAKPPVQNAYSLNLCSIRGRTEIVSICLMSTELLSMKIYWHFHFYIYFNNTDRQKLSSWIFFYLAALKLDAFVIYNLRFIAIWQYGKILLILCLSVIILLKVLYGSRIM
jgi:hypothetical protein